MISAAIMSLYPVEAIPTTACASHCFAAVVSAAYKNIL